MRTARSSFASFADSSAGCSAPCRKRREENRPFLNLLPIDSLPGKDTRECALPLTHHSDERHRDDLGYGIDRTSSRRPVPAETGARSAASGALAHLEQTPVPGNCAPWCPRTDVCHRTGRRGERRGCTKTLSGYRRSGPSKRARADQALSSLNLQWRPRANRTEQPGSDAAARLFRGAEDSSARCAI